LVPGSLAAWALTKVQSHAAEREEEIDVSKVPAKIGKAANLAIPNARWTGAYKYLGDEGLTYELEGTNGKGQNIWVYVDADETMDADGEVSEVLTEISFMEAPKVVIEALTAKVPQFQVETTCAVREQGRLVRFDFEGSRPGDKEVIGVYVSADGKSVETD